MIDILQAKRACARAYVYLYRPPFEPSIRYVNGGEYFVVPRGWALIRSRHGMLVWLELVDDGMLPDAILELLSGNSPVSRSWAGGGARAGSPSPFRRPGPLSLSLPAASGGVLGQLDIRTPRACPADVAVRVPCEDVLVMRPGLSSAADDADAPESQLGLRATVGSDSASAPCFDELLKAWLSSWEVQV